MACPGDVYPCPSCPCVCKEIVASIFGLIKQSHPHAVLRDGHLVAVKNAERRDGFPAEDLPLDPSAISAVCPKTPDEKGKITEFGITEFLEVQLTIVDVAVIHGIHVAWPLYLRYARNLAKTKGVAQLQGAFWYLCVWYSHARFCRDVLVSKGSPNILDEFLDTIPYAQWQSMFASVTSVAPPKYFPFLDMMLVSDIYHHWTKAPHNMDGTAIVKDALPLLRLIETSSWRPTALAFLLGEAKRVTPVPVAPVP